MSTKRLFLGLALLTVSTVACQQSVPDLTPKYEGQYAVQFSSYSTFDNMPIQATSSIEYSLVVTKNPDGTYTFKEKKPDNTVYSYQASLVGTTFEVPTETKSLPVNGVNYDVQFVGSGEFKTNSVTITRTAAFTAGTVKVSSRWTTYAYR